jgi:hypothetical protein
MTITVENVDTSKGNQDDSSNNNAPNKGKGGDSGNQPPTKQDGENPPGDDDPLWKDSAKVKSYVQDLRKESAKYRTENKDLRTKFDDLSTKFGNLEGGLKKALGIEEENASPEEQIGVLTKTVDSLQFENAMGSIAREHELKGEKAYNYFKFLISEAVNELEENDELSDEQILGFADQAKKAFGNNQAGTSSTTVENDKGGSENHNPDSGNTLTLQQFVKMTLAEKGNLYGKNPSLYKSLMAEAREKRLI